MLAHEIGHYKKRHVVKLLGVSIAGVFIALRRDRLAGASAVVLSRIRFRVSRVGFAAANVVPAMLLFALLAGTIGFWVSPLVHIWSRRFEYEADAFARATMGDAATA